MKAKRDRSHDIRTKGATMNPDRLSWLRAKVAKDGSDIIALLDSKDRGSLVKGGVDYIQLDDLAKEFNLTGLVSDTLQEVLSNKESLSLYGRTLNSQSILKHVKRLGLSNHT